jgi:hypothetical protein
MDDLGVKRPSADYASIVEIGFVLLGAALIGLLAILLFGRLAGGATRARRHAQAPPLPGSVPPERHTNIQTNSAR